LLEEKGTFPSTLKNYQRMFGLLEEVKNLTEEDGLLKFIKANTD